MQANPSKKAIAEYQMLNSFSVLKENVSFMAGIDKMLNRIANREDPDLTASSEAV